MGFKSNYHTHSKYSDGKDSIEDIVQEAIKREIKILGFTPHYPINFMDCRWCIKKDKINDYLDDINKFNIRYPITILAGFECDFIPDKLSFKSVKKDYNIDYIIGSVHLLENVDNRFYTIDGNKDNFIKILNTKYNGDIKKLINEYYFFIELMVKDSFPDIIGHFDLIKVHNEDLELFDESETWYIDVVYKTLKSIKNHYMPIIEINSRGIAKGKTSHTYPSFFIINMANELGFKFVINSDAHSKEYIDFNYEEVKSMLKGLNINKVVNLIEGKWVETEL